MKIYIKNQLLFFVVSQFILGQLLAQTITLTGKTVSTMSREGLASVNISVFNKNAITSSVSNKDGFFSIIIFPETDSVKFSMIGFRSKVFTPVQLGKAEVLEVRLDIQPLELPEVMVKPLSAIEIMERAVERLPYSQPSDNFESSGFYREIIKDRENYLSVAEAIFNVQFFPAQKTYKLKLDKGRAKDNVSYSSLFEYYHPGGGPQRAVESSFLTGQPSFLKRKEIKKYDFKKDSSTYYDGRWLYVISFDQKKGVKESLDKGRIFIEADDFSVIKYEAENSPAGIDYIKHLKGTDKMFAELLNIDFRQKGWKRVVDFVKAGDKWLLHYADIELYISYKQIKKNLDLDLTISLELLLNASVNRIIKEIDSDEEWQKKQLVRNLPVTFDPAYWGSASTIIPTKKINDIVAAIATGNNERVFLNKVTGWNFYKESSFVSYQHSDSVTLIPISKTKWEDNKTGPLLYKELSGDFSIEAKIDVSKISQPGLPPDKGFQQCGIMARIPDANRENHLSLTIGTGGNKNIKLSVTQTTNGKSRTVITRIKESSCWLKLEKRGRVITGFKKETANANWEIIKTYEIGTLNKKCQAGLMGYAHFSGDGPKMYPDIKGIFSVIKIINL